MNKELWINLGGTFVVVIAALIIHDKFVKPSLGV